MTIVLTPAMEARLKRLRCGEWKAEGDGYYSLRARGPTMSIILAYIALPPNHPLIGADYDSLSPEVNGGLTFGEDNVFGWDYGHAYNRYNVQDDIKRALEYFREKS